MTKLYVSLILLGLLLVAACTSSPTPTATAAHTPISVAVPTSVPGGRVAVDGDTVAVHYYGTLDTGEMFDSSREREPLSFILGSGQMITGFDAAVHDMKVGDTKVVRLGPDEAYGEHHDDRIVEFPIDQLPEGLSKSDNVLFQNGAQGVILEITDEVFRVDANHRLAGQALTFEIELISIQ